MKVVEGAILIPLFCFMILVACEISINLYQEVCNQKEYELTKEMWEVEHFYQYKGVREIIND